MDKRSVVPLDEDSLVAWARRNTGLSDFGANDWYEPFKVLIRSLDEDADLHLMGRLMARAEILNLLEARLQIENEFRLHPEIAEETISRPLVIMGQGRSGTSVLLNFLAADPRMGAPMHWELQYPVPAPRPETYRTDGRIERADRFIRQQVRVTPEIDSMHEFGGAVPQECIKLWALNFMSMPWWVIHGQVKEYANYMVGQDMALAYAYQKRVMQLLQWKNPRRHWVLKTPAHLDYLPQLLKVFPDACLVWTHRDPVKALASMINFVPTLQWAHSNSPMKGAADNPNPANVFDAITNLSFASRRLEQVIDWIEQGVVPRERICNIQYRDFMRDPIDTVTRVYNYFGIGFPRDSRKAIEDYITRNPRDARPAHQYTGGSRQRVEEVRAVFKRYQDYFGVPNE